MAYFVITGVVYGSLPEHWKDDSSVPDNFARFGVSIFWPFSAPVFVGIGLVRWLKQPRKPSIPRAVAKEKRST